MALAVPPGGTPPPTNYLPVVPLPSSVPLAVTFPHGLVPPRRPLAPPAAPVVTVVIVNFCQWRNTGRLVGQLLRAVALRTGAANAVVVDNHSPFHPVVRKLEKLRGVTVRRFSRNLGFARGVNRGVSEPPCPKNRRARAAPVLPSEWVLLLNPDVTVQDG